MALSVLLVDENAQWREHARTVLEFMEYEVTALSELPGDPGEPADFAAAMVGRNGDDSRCRLLVREIRTRLPDIPVLLMDAVPGTPPDAHLVGEVNAVVELPLRHRLVQAVLQRHLIRVRPPTMPRRAHQLFRSLVGSSPAITGVLRAIDQVSGNDDNGLIVGEPGTGKEVAARKLHYFSSRRDKPFVVVSCTGVPPEQLEVSLFGLELTGDAGTRDAQPGFLEQAQGGTLYLEDAGGLSARVQTKLQRAIRERTYERVGSHRSLACDVRIIATSSDDLRSRIDGGQFHEDLFALINVVSLTMPPLRERQEDIPKLIEELLIRLRSEQRATVRLSQGAIDALKSYPWPGNLRELASLIERLSILLPNGTVDVHDLPSLYSAHVNIAGETTTPVRAAEAAPDPASLPRLPREGLDIKEHLSTLEYTLIKQALDEAGGVVAHAAERLRLRRTTLVEKLRKYGISRGSDEASGF